MSQTLDYSKWDNLELSDEEEVQPQRSRGGLRFDTDALQRGKLIFHALNFSYKKSRIAFDPTFFFLLTYLRYFQHFVL